MGDCASEFNDDLIYFFESNIHEDWMLRIENTSVLVQKPSSYWS
jgi:hypothetical protein